MTMTVEEFDALPINVREKYLAAAHGIACRLSNGSIDVIGLTGSPQIVMQCAKKMKRIHQQARRREG